MGLRKSRDIWQKVGTGSYYPEALRKNLWLRICCFSPLLQIHISGTCIMKFSVLFSDSLVPGFDLVYAKNYSDHGLS